MSNEIGVYQRVKACAEEVRAAGMSAEADDILAALTISSVPGEVLGAARAVLMKVDTSQIPVQVRLQVWREIEYLNSIL